VVLAVVSANGTLKALDVLDVVIVTAEEMAAVPVVFWFSVGTSDAWIVDITTFVPLPRRY
jgi:hypothetical protein